MANNLPVSECSCSVRIAGGGGVEFSFEEKYATQPSAISRVTIYLRTAFNGLTVVKGYVVYININ